MIKPGLVSVTFRQLEVPAIIDLVSKAGLEAIEWGGDVHVPHSDISAAEKARRLTYDAGLKIAAYGSYYRVAESEKNGLSFYSVLDTTETLGASCLRVWAGAISSGRAGGDYWKRVVDEAVRIAELASDRNIRVVFEFHEGTLNDNPNASKRLLEMICCDNVGTYWQPMHGVGAKMNSQGIDAIFRWIEGIHVFHWWPTCRDRLLLREGSKNWKLYLSRLSRLKRNIYALLEFVKDDDPENFLQDAETLKLWLSELEEEQG